MPKYIKAITIIVVVLAMLPIAIVSRGRSVPAKKPRLHFVQDMDNQNKFRAQHANPLFADGRAMRPVIEGTVAQGELNEDSHTHRGIVDGAFTKTFPPHVTVDRALLDHGRERFTIYCTPCHGQAGYGDGMVSNRALELMAQGGNYSNGTSWVQAKSLHDDAIRIQPVGEIFSTITLGKSNMPSYAAQIPVDDRWAIVAYVKALQLSQNASEEMARQADTAAQFDPPVIEIAQPAAPDQEDAQP